jgi:hypothetical protein
LSSKALAANSWQSKKEVKKRRGGWEWRRGDADGQERGNGEREHGA